MPSAQLTFRSVCGHFASVLNYFMLKRSKFKIAMRTTTLKLRTHADGVTAGLILSLFCFGNLLILSGDIEMNPGPPKMTNTRQTKLTVSGRGSKKCSMDGTSSEVPPPPQQSIPDEPTLNDVMDLLTSMNSSWSQPWQTSDNLDRNQPTAKAAEENIPTEKTASNDFTSILDNINSKFTEIQKSVSNLTDLCKDIQNEMVNLKEEMTELRNKQEEVQKSNSLLSDKIETLEKKTDDLQYKCNRSNLIFHGVSRRKNETNAECQHAISKLISEKLGVAESVQFENVHRINSKPHSPIIVSFVSFQQKQSILRARHKLKGSSVFVSEDFPMRIREVRKKLIPFLKEAKKKNKRASIIYDHLIIDGKTFDLSLDGIKERA